MAEIARVAIDRRRRAAADQLLYSLSVHLEASGAEVDASPTFHGHVRCPAPLAGPLSQALASLRSLGGATSRGLGKVSIQARVDPSPSSPLADRIRRLNQRLADALDGGRPAWAPFQTRWKAAGALSDLPRRLAEGREGFISAALLSDAILPELHRSGGRRVTTGRHDFVLQPEMLWRAAGVDADLRLMGSWATAGERSGWNAAWALPREVEPVSRMGAVFLYWTSRLDLWTGALEAVEQTGVGERVAEGFGQVAFASGWHQQSRKEKGK